MGLSGYNGSDAFSESDESVVYRCILRCWLSGQRGWDVWSDGRRFSDSRADRTRACSVSAGMEGMS